MRFYVGLRWHMLRWVTVPALVSLNAAPKHRIPRARARVIIDGGGFQKVNRLGGWDTTPEQHARRMRFVARQLGYHMVDWCAIQDWMCEPESIAKTGLSVEEHQRRTVQSYLDLTRIDPTLPWLPVIQGWTLDDYMRCVDMYAAAGVDLTEVERVGVGSVCSRQSGEEVAQIIVALIRRGIRVHAFGVKLDGLRRLRALLTDWEWENMLDADSAAWSDHAKKQRILLAGHYHGPKTPNCANCWRYALVRRLEVLSALGEADVAEAA